MIVVITTELDEQYPKEIAIMTKETISSLLMIFGRSCA